MAPLRAFTRVLQQEISLADTGWKYEVEGLPSPEQTNAAKLIKTISFVSSLTAQHVTLRLESAPSNRVMRSDPLCHFLTLSFADFRLREPRAPQDESVRLAPSRESSEYITRLLQAGISINGVTYNFFGHSNSQLKSRSCVLFAATKEVISAKVEALGDFSKIKTVGKKAKRIGLLFSTADMAIELDPARCENIRDITHNDYVFTDGCGRISAQLAKKLIGYRAIVYRNRRYTPSVFQIRYRGYKGVLTLCPELKGKTQVQFRESMRKFKDAKDVSLSIVDYSKPYMFGFLNDEIVLLLQSLGIPQDVLCRKQNDYLKFLQAVANGDSRAAFQFASLQDDLTMARKLLMDGFDSVRASIRSAVKQEYAKMLNKRDEQKCRIMIQDSRLLFGICDPSSEDSTTGKLRPGTCFVRITKDGDGQARTLINTEVLVTRNPCCHPGDLQKFKAVNVPAWSNLVDCIVFPTCGSRPSADLMSGGDLDGDKFFVTWDPEIIPRQIAEPAAYPAGKECTEFGNITNDKRAEFFAQYTNASLGRVKNLYLKWARVKGPMSPECQQLNRLFSQSVDGNRIQVPPFLTEAPEPPEGPEDFILDRLHEDAARFVRGVFYQDIDKGDFPLDVLGVITRRESLSISEFDLIQLVLQKCTRDNLDFYEFIHAFNYAALSDEQRAWLANRIPSSLDLQSLIQNGLFQSELLLPGELRRFGLHHPSLRWKPVFTSTADRMGRFLSATAQSMEFFHKKLVVLQASERLTLMIYVPYPIPKASETKVDSSIRVFALPRSSGVDSVKYRVLPTKINSRLFCDDSVFQLYELKRANTFVFLIKGPMDSKSYGNIKSEGERRRQKAETIAQGINFECRASVALNKISAPIQEHVGRMNRDGILAAEVYCISNRDVESMRFLDQWAQYVDTEERMPLFEPDIREYTRPSLKTMDQSGISPEVANVVWRSDLAGLRNVEDLDHIHKMLQLLDETGQRDRIRAVYTALVNLADCGDLRMNTASLLSVLVNFLPRAPYSVPILLDSSFWKAQRTSISTDDVSPIFLDILRELVLSTNQLQAFVERPFKLVLKEMRQMSLQDYADLVEMIALCIEDPEFALDILLGCLKEESNRLLQGTEAEISRFTGCLTGIALDHIDEARASPKFSPYTLELKRAGVNDGFAVVDARVRIDLPSGSFKIGDHVRLAASSPPQNAPLDRPYTMDAIVISSHQGAVKFRCLHSLPSFVSECSWKHRNCGSFVTGKSMIDAVASFYSSKTAACPLYDRICNGSTQQKTQHSSQMPESELLNLNDRLNASQRQAIAAAMQGSLALLWGPPGTGKTQTIVAILRLMIRGFPKSRILVTAPTHNAVDNMLQRFIQEAGFDDIRHEPLRVSTSLNKVSPSLRKYTCDAMMGKDLSDDFAGRREAQKRVQRSRLIFTTCVGASIGLLRSETFDIALIDEASQQTEPASLIPLVKGCHRAILVGDHVQLRATVQRHAVVSGFDVSLFERLYLSEDCPGIAKVMLDTQYRMHPDICSFSSSMFYDGRLQTDSSLTNLPMSSSQFPWPPNSRKVFVQSESPEDLGHQSKSNQGQVGVCVSICQLLSAPPKEGKRESKAEPAGVSKSAPTLEIAILTPYTRQRMLLQQALPSYTVSSIDGYQGREADVVIFTTVRSNSYYDIGFLQDLRRLNVALTRARKGLIIVGDKNTLTKDPENLNSESKVVWKELLRQCSEIILPAV